MNLFEQNMLMLLNVRGISHKSLVCCDLLIVKPYRMIQISNRFPGGADYFCSK